MTNATHPAPDRPSPDEAPSTTTVRRFRARSTGLNRDGVWVIGPVLAELHVRRWDGDVYRATVSVHVDGRHQYGQPAAFLDADGLPKGGPVVDWHELTDAGPAVELRHTGELVEGDTVHLHGMRLRLGPVTEHAGSHGPYWRSTGELLNVAEVEADAAADPAGAAAFIVGRMSHDHPGTWTVQGNRLARWAVELPAAAPSPVAALAVEVDAHGFATEHYGRPQ